MRQSVFCSECGECLDNLPSLPLGERVPCPKCGATLRTVNARVILKRELSQHEAMLARSGQDGRAIGFRESAREGRATSADRDDDGSLAYSISGTSPQGEEDTLTACKRLVRVLNASGGNWTAPVLGEGIIDCEACDKEVAEKRLSIQVVRAIVDQDLWEQLNRQGSFEEVNVRKGRLVTKIKEAIEKKANDQTIPSSVRPSLTLALDATRLPVLGFEDVVEGIQARLGSWIRSLGFEAVWLVGPQNSLTWRLDA
ncbi:MAG: hypothetical protein U9R48_09605 [Chloroflexota bacterium]|nr:hypothetical protein [Chloroflexota bacterium]